MSHTSVGLIQAVLSSSSLLYFYYYLIFQYMNIPKDILSLLLWWAFECFSSYWILWIKFMWLSLYMTLRWISLQPYLHQNMSFKCKKIFINAEFQYANSFSQTFYSVFLMLFPSVPNLEVESKGSVTELCWMYACLFVTSFHMDLPSSGQIFYFLFGYLFFPYCLFLKICIMFIDITLINKIT